MIKLDVTEREAYLILIALGDKLQQLNALPAPVADTEKAEYAKLGQTFNQALQPPTPNEAKK